MIYRLLREHRINKILQPRGYEVTIPDQLGEWWVEQGIAERTGPVPVEVPRVLSRSVVAAPKLFAKVTPRFKCCGWK